MSMRSSVTELFGFLVPLLLLLQCNVGSAQNSSSWQTLSGNAPIVIARGGFSGLFPDSSSDAYSFAALLSLTNVVLWCDVQLTSNAVGICASDVILENFTTISGIPSFAKNTYNVNGVNITGWFSVDFSYSQLLSVTLKQSIYSRPPNFDYNLYPLLTVENVSGLITTQPNPLGLWLNIQHDIFYSQQNLNMTAYVLSISKQVNVNYFSSPELNFLTRIAPTFRNTTTKLIFRFLDQSIVEPTTNQTYGSLLKNLTRIKSFASGILVPKTYIWPVSSDNYLLSYTSIVGDAHKAGLEIYAADLANDNQFSFNYSYDPLAESLSYIDNSAFSVDGLLSDFPATPSRAIDCFSHINKSNIDHGNPLIFSHNGASGDYPDCTDLAYQKAVSDGADFIDCPIQFTKDGIALCMSSIDLRYDTTVLNSPFSSLSSIIPEIQSNPGIFTFNLTWDEIQKNLKPAISSPEATYSLYRNPRYKNSGNFMRLSDFLTFAKNKPLAGVLITVEFAAFMAEKLGYSAVDTVISALEDAGYKNQTALEVMIQSTDSAVLVKFKQQTKYKLLYQIDESISNADAAAIADIKGFANAVAVNRNSVFAVSNLFTIRQTDLVSSLQNASLDVYAYVFRNEFTAQPWDFLSDATVEINQYVLGVGVNGIITDFPETARAYKRNSCTKSKNIPNYMLPVQPGGLLQLISSSALPPALAPMPVLNVSDVAEPPLPPVASKAPPSPTEPATPPSQPSNGQRNFASVVIAVVAVVCGSLLV